MRATSKLLALAFTAALQPAMAGVVSLNFEDLVGSSPLTLDISQLGAYHEVKFTGGAWGVTSNASPCNGYVSFSSPSGCGALELAQDALGSVVSGNSSFTLDLAGGFTAFSFDYSARAASGAMVQLFGGAGGTGTLLQTVNLIGSNCAQPGVRFCDWNSSNIQLNGTALSFKVTGADQSLLMDNFLLTRPTSGGTVPEPASIALALGALGAAGWARRRGGAR